MQFRRRVVNLDVVRTRMNLLNPELSATLEKALTLFCKRNGVLYKQGINEIMVPFVAWRRCPGVPLTSVYDCFEAFFRRYLLNLYFDEEFNSLELLFRLITIILKYHDPALARFLAENDITPELYSTAWFMTLFAKYAAAHSASCPSNCSTSSGRFISSRKTSSSSST